MGGAMKANRMVIAWSERKRDFIDGVKGLIPADAEARGVEFKFTCTAVGAGENREQRMNIGQVVQMEAEASERETLAVVSCGPGPMADLVRKEVLRCIEKGLPVELFEESFAW
jgi:hypothetical protein